MKYFKFYKNFSLNKKLCIFAISSSICLASVPILFQNKSEVLHCYDESLELKLERCKKLVKQYQIEHGIPGVIVGVSIDGKIVYKKGFGYSDVENNIKAHGDTVMRIASISKPITCAIAAKLYENGKLDFDKSINEYMDSLPSFIWNNKMVIITPRQLISHTSGIRHYKKDENFVTKEANESKNNLSDVEFSEFYIKENYKNVTDALPLFINDKLLFEPGTNYYYSTHAYTLLSAIMEKSSGRKFTELLKETFEYFGMNQTYLDENDPLIQNRARYYTRNDKKVLKNVAFVDNSYKWAGGGLLSSVCDLLKFANNLLICYQNDFKNCFLNQSTMKNFVWSKQSTTTTKYKNDVELLKLCPQIEVDYGMGWFLCTDKDSKIKCIYHTGGALGCISCLMIIPTNRKESNDYDRKPKGITIAILCNSDTAFAISKLAAKIGNILLDDSLL